MSKRGLSPVDMVKGTLNVDDATALQVVRNLGAVLSHDPTRAFIARAWHLSTTTIPASGSDRDVFVAEGHRQAGLFLVACAQSGLDLRTYHTDDGDNGE